MEDQNRLVKRIKVHDTERTAAVDDVEHVVQFFNPYIFPTNRQTATICRKNDGSPREASGDLQEMDPTMSEEILGGRYAFKSLVTNRSDLIHIATGSICWNYALASKRMAVVFLGKPNLNNSRTQRISYPRVHEWIPEYTGSFEIRLGLGRFLFWLLETGAYVRAASSIQHFTGGFSDGWGQRATAQHPSDFGFPMNSSDFVYFCQCPVI